MYRTVIVEDDPMIASINQTFLSRDPRFSLAAVFHSGQEALEWLRKRPVELLILDVYMPRMSGLELLRELRAELPDFSPRIIPSAFSIGRISSTSFISFSPIHDAVP